VTEDFLGNGSLRKQLGRMAREESLHHCLLFEGTEGVGKATTARWLAQMVNCEAADRASWPCGACWSCRMIPKGQHPDVIEVGPDPEKTARIISVRQARELLAKLRVKPHSARKRMVIIEPVDSMSVEAANAMLKTLEDPPSDTGFILVSAKPAQILATVKSRSQRIRFGPVPDHTILSWLQTQGHEVFDGLLAEAAGGPGRALALSELGEESRVSTRRELLGAVSGSLDQLLAYGESLCKGSRGQWRPRVEVVLVTAEGLIHDLVLILAGKEAQGLAHASEARRLRAWADVLGMTGTACLLDAVRSARADLDANVNGRLVMDTLLSRWARELGRARTAPA
jgi:DNA polymerase-3 subunit delta'